MTDRKPRVPSAVMSSRLQDDGGFTFSEPHGEFADSGVFAAQWGTESKTADATPGVVDKFRSDNAESLGRRDNFLGGWRSEEAGGDFLDVTKRFNTRGEAHEFGRRNAQIAAFDLNTFDEVPIDYGASKLPKQTPDNLRTEYNELGRSAVDAQLHGRADPSQAKERGAAIADKILQQETLQRMGQGYTDEGPEPEFLLARLKNRIGG